MGGSQFDFGEMLKSFGPSVSGIDRIKLGRGLVGKLAGTLQALLAVCFITVVAGIFLRSPLIVLAGLAAGVVCFLLNSLFSIIFSMKYPAIALLEGAEFVKYRQLEMAAKEIPSPPSQPNIEPPALITSEAPHNG